MSFSIHLWRNVWKNFHEKYTASINTSHAYRRSPWAKSVDLVWVRYSEVIDAHAQRNIADGMASS
jgi:hypothetical protein